MCRMLVKSCKICCNKGVKTGKRLAVFAVAPLAGAWIEILAKMTISSENIVAPLAGAWIEIHCIKIGVQEKGVAPLAGAWIEIN